MKSCNSLIQSAALALVLIWSNGVAAQPVSLPFYISKDMTPLWEEDLSEIKKVPDPEAANSIHRVANFVLTNQDGKTISDRDFSDQIKIVNFFFASCPGVCPTSMKNLQSVQQKLKADSVKLLSFSITPNIDTPEKLNLYAQSYGIQSESWQLLTGEPSAIDSLARDSFFAVLDRNVSENAFVHTEKVFLVDKNQYIRGVYNATAPGDLLRLVEDVRTLELNQREQHNPDLQLASTQ